VSDDNVEIDYEHLAQEALRQVARDALAITAELGDAPGSHHFYIEFATGAAGVEIPDHLRESYPEQMTIVLQHQFTDLSVDDDGFAVTLSFNRKPARLVVPYSAMTSFVDPSANFVLRFPAPDPAAEPARKAEPTQADETAARAQDEADGEEANVVSIDAFRKK